jgi:hypothetical protein
LLPFRPEPFVFLSSKNIKIRIYRTIILPVDLYGCETCSLTLREEHRLKVFENGVLRRIFGPKNDEVMGGWRKLHNDLIIDCNVKFRAILKISLMISKMSNFFKYVIIFF